MRFKSGFYALEMTGAAPLDNPSGMTVFFSVMSGSGEHLDGFKRAVIDAVTDLL